MEKIPYSSPLQTSDTKKFAWPPSPSQLVLSLTLPILMLLVSPSYAQDSSNTGALEEIIVTGTYLQGRSQADNPSPTTVIGLDDLNSIGAANVADLISTLTINNGSQNNPDAFTQNSTVGSSNFNLRGLGVAATLVLLNGRRQVSTGTLTNDGVNFVDTNALVPQIAIKRLEILKDGAAAIYGTDAVAGVVNFITDDDFKGVALNVRGAEISGGEGSQSDSTLEAKVGWGNDKTNVVLAGSYFDRTPLTTAERRLSNPEDDTSALGNPGSFFLTNLAGGALPVLDPTGCADVGGIPQPLAAFQPLLDAAGIPFQAGTCGFDFGDFFNLVAEEERFNLFATVTHNISDESQFRFEAAYTSYDAERGNSPTFPFLQLGSAVVPASNPFNIFPEALGTALFFGRVSGVGGEVSPSTTESETLRLSAELNGNLGGSWRYDLGATFGTNSHDLTTEDTVTSRFSNALAGFGGAGCDPATGVAGQGPCQFFNPFATSFGPFPNSPELLDFIIDTQLIESESDLIVLDAVFSGTIGSTSAGEIGLAVGAQYRAEDFERNLDDISNNDGFAFIIGGDDFEGDRDIFAVFAELAIPLSDTVDLSAAVRYEDYGDAIGDTLDPKISVLYRPNDDFALRASASTSFRAPSQFQVSGQLTSLQQVNDPLGGTAFAAIRSLDPGDSGRDIQPEESEAFNFGASFTPVNNLSIDIDYWRFDFTDAIIQSAPQAIVDADPTGPNVLRSPGGTILFVFNDFLNASSIETDGIDLDVKYTFDTNVGTFSPFFNATEVFNYDIEDPQAGFIEGAGNRNFTNFGSPTPETRLTAGIGYATNGVSARLAYRSVSSFIDDQNDGDIIGSFDTVDAQVNLDFQELFGGSNTYTASLGVTNLTNELPPQVATNGGFESRTHDPRGRVIYLQLGAEF